MTTLYELLGALPGADADDLRDAFRQAVKGVHPDIRPDDPEAALNFRLIVYAMEILRDPEQRAAYDHLLELARQELVSQQRAAKIRNFAFAMMGLASVSVVAVGAYLLLAPMAAVPPQSRQVDEPSRASTETGSGNLSVPPALNDNSTTARPVTEATKPAEQPDDFLARWGVNDLNAKADRNAETVKPAEEQNDLPPQSEATDNNAQLTATPTPRPPPDLSRDDLPPGSGTTTTTRRPAATRTPRRRRRSRRRRSHRRQA